MTISSPVATGGGGDHFEEHVAGFLLGLLLVRATPPILTDTSVVSVHLQTRHLGWRTDDVLVVGETSEGERRQLAIQSKRTFRISEKDTDCSDTFRGMWRDFQTSDRFDRAVDRFAIVTLRGTDALLRHFSSLLDCARAASDSGDFVRRTSVEGYISNQAKRQSNVIRSILNGNAKNPVSDDQYWQFLRTINILSLDLNTSTSQTSAGVISLLAITTVGSTKPLATAQATWSALVQCAAEGRPIAKSYTRDELPKVLLSRHSPLPLSDHRGLEALIEHGNIIRSNIRTTIGDGYEIDRSSLVSAIMKKLDDERVVVVSGSAGSGKSALAKQVTASIEGSCPILAFGAVEFATPHLDGTLALAGTNINTQRLFALLAGHAKKVFLVESVERLLEHSTRDAFVQFLQQIQIDQSIQLILTVRDYSVETVRNAFLDSVGLSHIVYEVPELNNAELKQIMDEVTNLGPALEVNHISTFLTTPYVLDIAARLDWTSGSLPTTAVEFRQKCWKELVCAERYASAGMPRRRERIFLEIAHRRATELRPFVNLDSRDDQAVEALLKDSLIKASPQSLALFSPAHDVLEDWAILHSFDARFSISDTNLEGIAQAVGGYPALRRAFRRWLEEAFKVEPTQVGLYVLRAVEQYQLPSYFRDDCFAAALLSESAGDFLLGCRRSIDRGNVSLLLQIIHMLRVACKESPRWLNVPGLPSQMLVPAGPGWEATLELVADLTDELLPDHKALLIGLVEDWATQIAWFNLAPPGLASAGNIVAQLLPLLESYGDEKSRKRLLSVASKIPHVVADFDALLGRAQSCDHTDRAGSDLADLILGDFSCGQICRHFPSQVMELVNLRIRISEDDLRRRDDIYYSEPIGVDCNFGISDEGISQFFPASSLQGPFAELLAHHPKQAAAFMLDLLNHAGDWYGKQRWPGRSLEPAWEIALDVPGTGLVRQWGNGRLYQMYRGTSVGPDVVQSALMALESWLLSIASNEDVNLEAWLLFILRKSNNVMTTAVVASVCIAHPNKAGQAGLVLLSCKDVLQLDLARSVADITNPLDAFFGLNPNHMLYEQERKKANALEHRKFNLEHLAVKMQFIPEYREKVWKILDKQYETVHEGSADDTAIWRLALHRMDIRRYKVIDEGNAVATDTSKSGNVAIGITPDMLDADLKEMVGERETIQAELNRHLGLLNRASKAWRGEDLKVAENWRNSLLLEARAIQRELGEPEWAWRGGPGVVAALCIRDHLKELTKEELEWCATQVDREVRSSAAIDDEYHHLAHSPNQPDRLGASVVCLMVADERCKSFVDSVDLLALALTHPVDEVARFASSGVALFLDETQERLVLRCAGAIAYRARLMTELRNENRRRAFEDRTWGEQIAERVDHSTRDAIKDAQFDSATEIRSIDLGNRTEARAVATILEILSQHPNWDEALEFSSRTLSKLVDMWSAQKKDHHQEERVNYEIEHDIMRTLATFALKLDDRAGRRLIEPITRMVDLQPNKVSDFLKELIIAADRNEKDCFWLLWQDFANAAMEAQWADNLRDEGRFHVQLVDTLFLGIQWKDGVKHWNRLNGDSRRLDDLACRMPPVVPCMRAYSRYLYMVGNKSLPTSFGTVNVILQNGNGIVMVSESNVAFHLETVLRPFVYGEPFRIKSDKELQTSVLNILDVLVASGSSSAYRMRDDFVTPSEKPGS